MLDIPPFEIAYKQLTTIQKVGQLFMPAAFINDSEEEIQNLEQLIKTFHIGSICFFHSRASAATNFEGKKVIAYNEESYKRLKYLIKRYQNAAQYPLLIAIDAEWGLAMRIENTPQYPYAITLGAMQQQEELVFQVGQQIARDCREAGIHWNLSPVVDINLNPNNPVIGYRSFGADRETVTTYARAYLNGMRSQGVLNAIKHFPGHGDTATDSHLGLPVINKSKKELLDHEIYPFIQLMKDGIDSIMVGHLAIPALSQKRKVSASLSKEIMIDFLRGELGWNGLIISDALNMHAISKKSSQDGMVEYSAFEAGNDVLCFANNVPAGIEMIAAKCLPERIDASFKRFWDLKVKAFANLKRTHVTLPLDHSGLMKQLATESITLLKGSALEIATIRNTGFRYLHFGQQGGYFQKILKENVTDTNTTLLGIFPRQVKPNDRFGFSDKELEEINELLDTGNAILYLFGNPFVLHLLKWQKAKAAAIVYQDFETFQRHAVLHFKGKVVVKGKLPVTL